MENLPKVERKTLTMKETAEYLGISYWLVNQLVSLTLISTMCFVCCSVDNVLCTSLLRA